MSISEPGLVVPRTSEEESLNEELFGEISELYNNGLYLQAYERAQVAGPLKLWTGRRSRLYAARLANHLGSPRVGRTLFRIAHRKFPTDPEVTYFHTYAMTGRRGVYESLKRVEQYNNLPEASDEIRADWFSLRALLCAVVRDFENADRWIQQSLELQPDRSWIHVQHSIVLDVQDRSEEAFAASEKALQLRPSFRPAVQNMASRLVQAHRDDEAIDLLQKGIETIEAGDLRTQLGSLFLELERYEEARKLFSNIENYFPMLKMEPKVVEALAAMNSDMHYYCGDHLEAAKHAKKTNAEFHEEIAKRLEDPDFEGKRVRLDVEFVRQDHMTCAPATLTSIARYWDKPAEHLDIVEEICYDGTPAHNERRWAIEAGYETREFRLTWESAVSLIDRGIPFTLTTTEPGSAHLQAVIGYDAYRHTFLVRDPGDRHSREFDAKNTIERYESTGPRAMAMVPKDKADLLDGLELPESKFYDVYFKLQLCLEKHDRSKAAQVVEKLVQMDPNHRMTLNAKSVIARYDSDLSATLETTEAQLTKYPKDANLQLARLACLSELGKAKDRIEMLRELNDDPKCHPVFWTQLANELMGDAREKENVDYLIRRSLKYQSEMPTPYSLMGSIKFEERLEDEAVEAFRLAACIDDKNEGRAKQYFYACRITNDTSKALSYLEDRVKRFETRSSLPARTLCWAYDQLENTKDSIRVLQSAYKIHRKDGEFLLYAAQYFSGLGKFEKAEQLLAKAKPVAHAQTWTRVAALVASYQGKNANALKYWTSLIKKDPLDMVAHRFATGLLADAGGSEAALKHLRTHVDRFPYSYALRSMLIDWVKQGTRDEIETELNEFLRHHPEDAWAHRELASLHLSSREFELAEQHIAKAEEVEPDSLGDCLLRARFHQIRNEAPQAKEQFRKAIKISIDNEYAMAGLIQCCNTKADREEQLAFVLDELKRQVGLGEGLLVYHAVAQTCLDADELYESLNQILLESDERWQSWVAVCRQLSDMQKHDEAIELATQGAKKFPLLPRMWMELANANASAGRIDDEIAALRKAKEINPNWSELIRMLAEALDKKGDLDGARKEITANLRVEPRDVISMEFLAGIMWRQEEKEEALQLIAKAVRMQPGFDRGWVSLRNWCAALGKPDFDVEVATELTQSRPNEARSWKVLALTLDQPHQVEEAIGALDKALALNPLDSETYEQKSALLCQLGMFDEAIQVVQPEVFRNDMPLDLSARAAWIEGERGNFDVAIAKMRQITQVDPDYFWAWQQLGQWYRFQENATDYVEAAREMVRIQPQNALSWGYLGDGTLAENKLDEAAEHFKQAVHLAPTYEYASGRLLDILAHQKRWDDAKEMLEFVTPHLAPEWVVSEQGRIAALSGDRELAFEKLRQICEIPAPDHSPIDSVVASIFEAGWREETLELLTKQINKPDALPGVAYVFVHLSCSMDGWDSCAATLRSIKNRRELWETGADKFMVEACTCGGEGKQHPRMKAFMAENMNELRGSTRMWQSTGSALCQGNLDAEVCEFMSDWESRPDATPEGLFPLVCSLWDAEREHEANKISTTAMTREFDWSIHNHKIYLALYQIIHGSPEAAMEHIRDVDPMGVNRHFQCKFETVICVLQSLANGEKYKVLKKRIDDHFNKYQQELGADREITRTRKLVQQAVARLHGKKWAGFKLKFLS